VLLGRQLPPDAKKSETDAASVVMLQNTIRQAVEDAQKLLGPSMEAWPAVDKYAEAMFSWQSVQFGLLQRAFIRRPHSDQVRVFLFLVDQSEEEEKKGTGNLVFFPAHDNPDPPLRIENSLAGNAILQTVGDHIEIINIANATLDPRFVARGKPQHFKSLLCIPILCYGDGDVRQPLFLLSIDSRLDVPFPPEYVIAARTVASCLGMVAQRFIDIARRVPQ
jgi:GAF domain-containing protein